ncbi:MAG: MBL fold metallo-hydrolase [Chloroflexota bacterium]
MQFSNHCYAVLGLAAIPPWVVNAGFVVGETTTLIVDSGMNWRAGQTILGYATAVRPSNRIIALNSEPHFDHIGGNGYFQSQGVTVYGHPEIQRTAAQFAGEKAEYNEHILNPVRRQQQETNAFFAQTTVTNPTQPVHDGMVFDLGGLEARIIYTPGHTPLNLSVFVPQDKALFCGDCLVGDYIPNLEAGNPALWRDWLVSLDKVATLGLTAVLPGHGGVLVETAVSAEIERHRDILQQAIRTSKAPTQTSA